MKNRFILIMLFLFTMESAFGQSAYYEKYQNLAHSGDTVGLAKLIPEWEKAEGSTGDVYAAWFNYYLLTDMSDCLSLTVSKPNGESIAFQDSTGKVAGYIGGQTTFGSRGMQLGLKKLDEGIAKYPDRVDLAFGKVHLLLNQYFFKDAVKELHRVLDRSLVNKNEWKWTHDESPANDGEGQLFLRSCMQDYFTQLYEQRQDSLAMVFVDDVILHYPKSVYFLNNKAALYAQNGKTKEALDMFLKIHELDPSDDLVTLNIGLLYRGIDKKKAKSYLEKLVKSSDERVRGAATGALEELSR